MSNIYALIDASDHAAVSMGRRVSRAIKSLRSKTTGIAVSLHAKIQHRQMLRRYERFSDHVLQDLGFERDWDRSILPIKR
jgi:hypothetical protein